MAARLLRVASAALGDTAGRWRLLARPRAGAGGLRGSRGPGLGGGAVATRTLSVSGRAQSSSEDKITVHFINRDGETLTTKGKIGDSLLDVVVQNNLDIDGFGACEGTLACSTCHLIFEQHIFEKLEAITDEENDMLDLAYGLTDSFGSILLGAELQSSTREQFLGLPQQPVTLDKQTDGQMEHSESFYRGWAARSV
uniref:Adrenal ferredoxin n=1 Tax=Bos indicus x Bos taurus TaxID=30522 RepID=A0A4W2BWW4_BOBOX